MAKVVHALIAAQKRGVNVRILLDKTMQQQSQSSVAKLQAHHVDVQYIDFKHIARGVMHAKYMIVDNQNVFVGSQNFGWKAIEENHEIGIRISNTALAKTLLAIFNLDWQTSEGGDYKALLKNVAPATVTQNSPQTLEGVSFYPAFSPKKFIPQSYDWELLQLLDLIDKAQQQILIQVYQYSDLSGYKLHNHWQAINKALLHAAARGVKVKLIVSDVMLKSPLGLRGLANLQGHINVDIRISAMPLYRYKGKLYGRVEHAKYMVIDNNISWIGTGNWQKDYFYHSRDIAIILTGQSINQQLQQVFWRDWNGPYVKPIAGSSR